MMHSCELAHALGWELPHQDGCGPAEQKAAGDCDHCNFCQVVDSGGVMLAVSKVATTGFVAFLPVWQPVLPTLVVEQELSVKSLPPGDPDCPPQRWQFAERTALPPRAPSIRA